MLIVSHRHRSEDLELWSEMEAADRMSGEQLLASGKIDASIKAIQEFVAAGPCYIGCSWGKDSVVTTHLCRMVDPSIPIIHLRPTNHNPDCDAVRDAYFAAFAGQPYQEVMVDYHGLHGSNLPHQDLDRETDRRWFAAIEESGMPWGGRHIVGIRADESNGRKVRMLRWGLNSRNGCAPIGWWSSANVFGYLATFSLPVHPAYAMLGNGRWPRDRLRVAEIGDTHGTGSGRSDWEREYYSDVLRRLEANRPMG